MTDQLELFLTSSIKPNILHYGSSITNWLTNFIFWWYIIVPRQLIRLIGRMWIVADDSLSYTLIIRNFFSPWHRDSNIAGWMVGITIKIIYIPISTIIIILLELVIFVMLLLWLILLPTFLVTILAGPFVF